MIPTISFLLISSDLGRIRTATTTTTEQLHRVFDFIASGFERKFYTSAVFLDISQGFDRVWHDRILLMKLKNSLATSFFFLPHFCVNENNTFSKMYAIKAGVPQGCVLSPFLYIFTGDMPTHSLLYALISQMTLLFSPNLLLLSMRLPIYSLTWRCSLTGSVNGK